jgi:hypothetical protein
MSKQNYYPEEARLMFFGGRILMKMCAGHDRSKPLAFKLGAGQAIQGSVAPKSPKCLQIIEN